MKRSIVCADIVEVPSDALIYSTNVGLMLTGGVGAALLRKFGVRTQIDLQSRSIGTGRQLAEVGEIIQSPIAGAPWKKVFHTIATDEAYRTDPIVVRSILKRCLKICAEATDVKTITCSALGAGYGDLDLVLFASMAEELCREFDDSPIDGFSVVSYDPKECETLLRSTPSNWNMTKENLPLAPMPLSGTSETFGKTC